MRADRLVALLLLLQSKGRVTAAEAALELEVSERTARRDLEALAMSGVPVYSRHGRGGGWQLVGGATTDLTGLSVEEAKSLFLHAGPVVADDPVLRSAMRKLTAALPETFRHGAEAASAAVKIDRAGWGRVGSADEPIHLAEITDAVVAARQIRLGYTSPRSGSSTRTVHPLGLVTKRGVWYLVSETDAGPRTFRVDRITAVETLAAAVERPPDFDLDVAWSAIVTEVETRRGELAVDAVVERSMLRPLRWQFGDRVDVVDDGPPTRVRLRDVAAEPLAAQIAGYGSKLELIDPPEAVVAELRRIARELNARYVTGV